MSVSAAKTRILGFDLLRLLSFLPICYFHGTLIYFYTTEIEMSKTSAIIAGAEVVTRSLAFGGFTIVFLSSLLTSLSSAKLRNKAQLFLLLACGWLGLSQLMSTRHFLVLAWDIYPLFIFGLLLAFLAEARGPKVAYALGAIGLLMLGIPFWRLAPYLGDYVGYHASNVLGVANCAREISDWPIFPWMGLIWAGAAGGCWLRQNATATGQIWLPLKKHEPWAWGAALTLSFPALGAYYHTRSGTLFTCDYYRQPPHVFYAHFVYLLFLLRLSLLPAVQGWLAEQAWVRWLSRRAISRKYWLAYAVGYLLIHLLNITIPKIVGDVYPEYYTDIENWFFPIMVFAYLPLIEIVTARVLVNAESVRRLWLKALPRFRQTRNLQAQGDLARAPHQDSDEAKLTSAAAHTQFSATHTSSKA